jgi:hypothetical protein
LPVVRSCRYCDARADRVARAEQGPEVGLEGNPQRSYDQVVPAAVPMSAAGTPDVAGSRFVGAQCARATALSSFIARAYCDPLRSRRLGRSGQRGPCFWGVVHTPS